MSEQSLKEITGFSKACIAALSRVMWNHMREPLLKSIRTCLEKLRHPSLVSASYIAADAEVSPSTVYRHIDRYGIPWRNIHGGRWEEGDGPRRIAWSEWQARTELHTRSVKNECTRAILSDEGEDQ